MRVLDKEQYKPDVYCQICSVLLGLVLGPVLAPAAPTPGLFCTVEGHKREDFKSTWNGSQDQAKTMPEKFWQHHGDRTVLHLFYGACGWKQYRSPGVCVKLIGGGEPACLRAEDNNPRDIFRL